MRKTIILEYNQEALINIKDETLVVRLASLENIVQAHNDASSRNQVEAIVVDLPISAVSEINFRPNWANVPLVINAYNLGDYNLFLTKTAEIRNLNIRVFLNSSSENVYTDLKLLASLGIDCGLYIEDNVKLDDEKFLDLASYAFLSPVPHATIQPFEHILYHLKDEKSHNFSAVYYDDPLLYYKYDSQSYKDGTNKTEQDEYQGDVKVKMETYYAHFMNQDTCSKCPAFKICNRKMAPFLINCQEVMSEIYEYAELQYKNCNH